MENGKNNTADRELRISRTLDAPVDLVWEVWTAAEHIANWWGPTGFTNTISKMDMRPDGEWILVMHGPDGTNYPNRNVFKEIIHHKKIVYAHVSDPKFTATIEFEAQGERTLMNWHAVFDSAELFNAVVKTYKADEGMRQNVEKLEAYLVAQKAVR
ncbi:MAG: SRPBCC family protein [Spirochaetia bacterium]|nr:SRPBCC family protein [Spirochaetia bacterium]